MENEYVKQAKDFLEKTKTEIIIEFKEHGRHFPGDKESRDIYRVTLKRGERKYTFNFGQSIAKSKRYIDKITKREFNESGKGLNNNYKVINKQFLKDFCFVVNGEAPSEYDILAYLQKYDVGTFENFCSDFGYYIDSRTAEKTYKNVCDEYNNLKMLFTDSELEEMSEIN